MFPARISAKWVRGHFWYVAATAILVRESLGFFLEMMGSAGGPILMPEAVEVDVLVVGAGPVGLTLAIDLAWRGINVAVVETRAAAEPPEPKCNHVAARTMEIFRRLGLAAKVRNSGLPADYPHDISYRTTFAGQELTRIEIPCRRDRFTRQDGPDCNWPTAEPPHRINQIFLEPILFEHAAALRRIRIVNRTSAEDVKNRRCIR